ncbi:hypothetical protein [Neoaquamicrobium sediminum]|uniref:hypothetical protein n=1 Tax=Neoaquamicrobium sediminum TaxID=1849104 RepID=UPI003BAD4A4C
MIAVLLALLGTAMPASAGSHMPIEGIGSTCLETILRNCRVLTAGYVNADGGDRDGEPMLAWQTQTGFTPEDGVMGGFVLFEHASGKWTVMDAGFNGWRFSPPQLSETGLLHIAGYGGGTGAYNADRLYQWRDPGDAVAREGWRQIDMGTWLKTIGEKLPAGLEIWKGVQFEFQDPWSGMIARTGLWRSDDGNCCPTGGSAVIAFGIEDDRLVVSRVDYVVP